MTLKTASPSTSLPQAPNNTVSLYHIGLHQLMVTHSRLAVSRPHLKIGPTLSLSSQEARGGHHASSHYSAVESIMKTTTKGFRTSHRRHFETHQP